MTESKNKYFRRTKLDVRGELMTLQLPRGNLGVFLAFLTFVAVTVNALIPSRYSLHAPVFWLDWLIRQPWFGVPFSFGVFFAVSRSLRERLELNRQSREIRAGKKVLCRFDQVDYLEVDTKFRVQVMNQVALVYEGKRRYSLLLYDGRPRQDVWEFANTIAAFLGVKARPEGD